MDKILFFDIDGTLAMRGCIPEGNLEMLKQLKAKEHKTFICTGRAVYYAKNMFHDLVTGYIACNGRYIEANDKKLHGESFTKEEMKKWVDKFKQLDLGYLFASDKGAYYGNIPQQIYKKLLKEYGEDRLFSYENQEVSYYTFDLFFDKNRFNELEFEFKDSLVLNNHYNGSCDCTTLNYNKGSAIAYLLDYYNIDKKCSYAFGDGANDVYMFRNVDNKIAMGNAIEALKQEATYVTDDYDKEGIKKALKHYGLV